LPIQIGPSLHGTRIVLAGAKGKLGIQGTTPCSGSSTRWERFLRPLSWAFPHREAPAAVATAILRHLVG
jgi:hypothetical protein